MAGAAGFGLRLFFGEKSVEISSAVQYPYYVDAVRGSNVFAP
jgi:hypothetical protein